jgi:hypothetical protein
VDAVIDFREGGVTVGDRDEKADESPFDTKIVPLAHE